MQGLRTQRVRGPDGCQCGGWRRLLVSDVWWTDVRPKFTIIAWRLREPALRWPVMSGVLLLAGNTRPEQRGLPAATPGW
jgi:hypothetical protein